MLILVTFFSATIITKHLVIGEYRRSDSNLAWLVTPVIFAIGVVYAFYKCFKEGICNRERYRYRNRSGEACLFWFLKNL